MKHKREFDKSYFHNPIVQGVNYSLFIMLLKEMESKGQSSVALAAAPVLSSQSSNQFCVFCVSPSPCREIARGALYIASFRSRQFCGDQGCIERTHEAWDGPHHATKKWAHVVGPSFPLPRVPHWHLLLTVFYFPKKLHGKIFGSVWHPEGPWKLKICKNKQICFVVSKTNERG
jgi:hypothetical protein